MGIYGRYCIQTWCKGILVTYLPQKEKMRLTHDVEKRK